MRGLAAPLTVVLGGCFYGTPPAPYFARTAAQPVAAYWSGGTVFLQGEEGLGAQPLEIAP